MRVLLKISGEAFSWENQKWFDSQHVQNIVEMIQNVQQKGHEIGIVVWWGNIYRGSNLIEAGVDSADSHNMSMLSTVFNGVTLQSFLHKSGISARVFDALGVEFVPRYISQEAKRSLDSWDVVICTSGTGTPYFSTDTAGVVRALELDCQALIKLTKVDGVYDSDPKTNPQAQKIDEISYSDFLQQDLKVFDQTGIIMARDNELPLYVCQMWDMTALESILSGGEAGTKIS